jgi:hypothetical protein
MEYWSAALAASRQLVWIFCFAFFCVLCAFRLLPQARDYRRDKFSRLFNLLDFQPFSVEYTGFVDALVSVSTEIISLGL